MHMSMFFHICFLNIIFLPYSFFFQNEDGEFFCGHRKLFFFVIVAFFVLYMCFSFKNCRGIFFFCQGVVDVCFLN